MICVIPVRFTPGFRWRILAGLQRTDINTSHSYDVIGCDVLYISITRIGYTIQFLGVYTDGLPSGLSHVGLCFVFVSPSSLGNYNTYSRILGYCLTDCCLGGLENSMYELLEQEIKITFLLKITIHWVSEWDNFLVHRSNEKLVMIIIINFQLSLTPLLGSYLRNLIHTA